MRTRKLGKSGVETTEIGLGTWSLSGEGYGPVHLADARATIEAALDAGVRFIDTASCYGPDGAIETILGNVLRDRGRECAFVATRIGVDRHPAKGSPRKNFERDALNRFADAALQRLRTDCVDAFILHNPLFETLPVAVKPLRELRVQGKARLVGVSVSTPDAARFALSEDIDLLELPYSVLYPKLLHSLASEIASSGVGVIVRSPLAYGLLADTWGADRVFGEGDHRSDRWSPSELARRVRTRENARYLVHDEVRSLREAAIRYVLANGLVHVCVVGARTPAQASENAHAADTLPYLPEQDLAVLASRLAGETG